MVISFQNQPIPKEATKKGIQIFKIQVQLVVNMIEYWYKFMRNVFVVLHKEDCILNFNYIR